MIRVAAIVEGHGELKAVPILLKRLTQWLQRDAAIEPDRFPVRVKRDQFLNRPGRRYNEPIDQPEFTRNFDLDLAHQNCRSFRKLCTEWQKIVAAAGS